MTDFQQAMFWTKYRLYNRKAHDYYMWLSKNQWLTREELDSTNWKKRKAIVAYAYEKTAFYRQWYDEHGFKPSDLKTSEDWERVPILKKVYLRENFNDLISHEVGARDRRLSTTGGSTGTPIKVYFDKRYPMAALGWRMVNWWGINPAVDAAYVYRLVRQTHLSQLINALYWWPTKRVWLDASKMTGKSIEAFISKYNKLQPKLLQGYAGAILYLAEYITERMIRVHSPSAIWVTSSPISETHRRLITRAFSAPVYDQYGCGEVFWIAAECERQHGLHIFADSRHVEIVDDAGLPCANQQEGRVLITDLENFAFPLIRYQNDDVATLWNSECDCGRNLPLMSPIKGRITDRLKLPDGSVISGEYVTTIFDDLPDLVKAFQVLQHQDLSLTLRVVPNPANLDLEMGIVNVRENLENKTGGQVPVSMEVVDEIPHNRGKMQYVVSMALDQESNH